MLQVLQMSIIRPSSSPYASPLHMVQKPEAGTWIPCRDFRKLNTQTIPDKYPISHLHDFAVGLHLKKVFHQIPVAETDIHKTVITTPFGMYEFVRIPFGLQNAAQPFQSLIDEVLRGFSFTFVYLDC